MKLGEEVVDRISGYKGVVMGRAEYLYGCVKILVVPHALSADGKLQEGEWFDEQRVDSASSAEAGGPMPEAPKS
jgi:hypothetical protein